MTTQLPEILDAIKYAENSQTGTHSRFDECNLYYQGIYKIRKQKGIDAYKPATAKRKVDVATDQIMSIGKRVIVPEWGQSQKAKEQAGILQRFGQAFIDHRSFIAPFRNSIKHGAAYGMYCLQGPIYLEDKYPKEPSYIGLTAEEKKEKRDEYENAQGKAFPWGIYAINPGCIFPAPSDCNKSDFFVKKIARKAGELKGKYPDIKKLLEYDDEADINWREWWTKKEYCYLIENYPVDDIKENWMGYIPFEIGYGGLGFETSDGDPAERAVGLIYHSMSAFRAEAQLKTDLLHYVHEFAYGKPRIVIPPGPDFKPSSSVGEVGVVGKEYEFQIDRPPPLNAEVWHAISMLESDVDKQTFSAVMEGRNPIGSAPSSGYDRALMNAADRINLVGLVASFEGSLGSILEHVGKCVRDVIGEPVSAWGYKDNDVIGETVKPEYFNSNPIFEVKLDGKSPEEIDQRMQLGVGLWGKGAISWETMCKDFLGRDPEQERNRILIEQVMFKNPQIQQAMAAKAAQIYGIEQQIEMAQDVQKIQEKMPQQNEPLQWAPPQMEGMRTQQRMGPMGQPTQMNTPLEQGSPV